MPLFFVQDADRPMHIIATDWGRALALWTEQVERENPPDGIEDGPLGIAFVDDDENLIVEESTNG